MDQSLGPSTIDGDRDAATSILHYRAATLDDLAAVIALLRPYVQARKLLKRTKQEMLGLLANAFVAEVATGPTEIPSVIGFCAIEIYSRKLAEIQCLAVGPGYQGRGVGSELVRLCVERARSYGVLEVMAISASETMFRHLGFDYSLPDQKKALFFQLKTREQMFEEISDED